MELGHILEVSQSKKEIDAILETAQNIKNIFPISKGKNILRQIAEDKIVFLSFSQPSSRTRMNTELGAKFLGAEVVAFAGIDKTSMAKGESWRNSTKTFSRRADIIVIRHNQKEIPEQAAYWCDKLNLKMKVINAGNDNHQHPLQAYGDLLTIKEHFPEFGKKPLKIAVGADLKNARVLHSLVAGLAQYPVELTLVSWQNPKTFLMPKKYLQPLLKNKVRFRELGSLIPGEKFDAIYWVRYQIEHGEKQEQKEYNQDFRITPAFLKTFLKDSGIFLHAGPRNGETDDRIDNDPRVKDGEQIDNVMFAFMALCQMILNPRFPIPEPRDL